MEDLFLELNPQEALAFLAMLEHHYLLLEQANQLGVVFLTNHSLHQREAYLVSHLANNLLVDKGCLELEILQFQALEAETLLN